MAIILDSGYKLGRPKLDKGLLVTLGCRKPLMHACVHTHASCHTQSCQRLHTLCNTFLLLKVANTENCFTIFVCCMCKILLNRRVAIGYSC